MELSITSVRVGKVAEYPLPAVHGDTRVWSSAIAKHAQQGAVALGREGFAGDAHADAIKHGGPDKAILGYFEEHLAYWRTYLDREDVGAGAFGENLSLLGGTEVSVCLGDVFSLGTALAQVSQPRRPCWKLARLWSNPKLTLEVERTGWTGFYLRVLYEGAVERGDSLKLVDRPTPEWTVMRAHRCISAKDDLREKAALSEVEWLPEALRTRLSRQASGEVFDEKKRLEGT